MEGGRAWGAAVTPTESYPPCTPPKHSSAIIKGREYNWRHLTNGGGLRLRQSESTNEGGREGDEQTKTVGMEKGILGGRWPYD